MLKHHVRDLKKRLIYMVFRLQNLDKQKFNCPICDYLGPFQDVNPMSGDRKHAKCPKCGSLERHRLQYLVVSNVLEEIDAKKLKMLHFAPEPFFKSYFSERFGRYETADLNMKGVDHNVDMQKLPFKNETYDFVFASHVLEHIPNDEKAILEIRRILKPNGIAILPVPVIAKKTIEYPAPNPNETNHVRAPGYDYWDRFKRHFSRIEEINSNSLPSIYQLFIYEDRSQWPTKECPLRPAMNGEKHIDIVPVCYA